MLKLTSQLNCGSFERKRCHVTAVSKSGFPPWQFYTPLPGFVFSISELSYRQLPFNLAETESELDWKLWAWLTAKGTLLSCVGCMACAYHHLRDETAGSGYLVIVEQRQCFTWLPFDVYRVERWLRKVWEHSKKEEAGVSSNNRQTIEKANARHF